MTSNEREESRQAADRAAAFGNLRERVSSETRRSITRGWSCRGRRPRARTAIDTTDRQQSRPSYRRRIDPGWVTQVVEETVECEHARLAGMDLVEGRLTSSRRHRVDAQSSDENDVRAGDDVGSRQDSRQGKGKFRRCSGRVALDRVAPYTGSPRPVIRRRGSLPQIVCSSSRARSSRREHYVAGCRGAVTEAATCRRGRRQSRYRARSSDRSTGRDARAPLSEGGDARRSTAGRSPRGRDCVRR